MIKCLQNGLIPHVKNLKIFEIWVSGNFEVAITFGRKAHYQRSDSHFGALSKLYKMVASDRKMSSPARRYEPIEIRILALKGNDLKF